MAVIANFMLMTLLLIVNLLNRKISIRTLFKMRTFSESFKKLSINQNFFIFKLKSSKFEEEKLINFVKNAPEADATVKTFSRADGKTYNKKDLTDNWINFSKSKISCRLNVGVGDIYEQISGNNYRL